MYLAITLRVISSLLNSALSSVRFRCPLSTPHITSLIFSMVGSLGFLLLSTSVHPSSTVGFELFPDGSEVCMGFAWDGVVRLAESFLHFSFSLILLLRLDISASNCCSLVFWVDRFFLLLLRFFDSPRFLPIYSLYPLGPVGGSPEFPAVCKSRPLSGAFSGVELPIPVLFLRGS
jgi:hypothetical protein